MYSVQRIYMYMYLQCMYLYGCNHMYTCTVYMYTVQQQSMCKRVHTRVSVRQYLMQI